MDEANQISEGQNAACNLLEVWKALTDEQRELIGDVTQLDAYMLRVGTRLLETAGD